MLFIKASGFVQNKIFSNRFANTFINLFTHFDSVEAIAEYEGWASLDCKTVRTRYALLLEKLSYKTDGYVIERIVKAKGIKRVLSPDFIEDYLPWRKEVDEALSRDLTTLSRDENRPEGKPVHLFPVPVSFARFLKFSLNVWESTGDDVDFCKTRIDEAIEKAEKLATKFGEPVKECQFTRQ